jgi:hypothetical protein
MSLLARTRESEIEQLLDCERAERSAATHANDDESRDRHVMKAERCADRAWSLSEEDDLPYMPSGLWR